MGGGEGEAGSRLGRVMSLSDMVLAFFEEEGGYTERLCDGGGSDDDGENGSSDEAASSRGGAEERRVFWESQHHLLQAALSRSSSLETRVRRETEAALRQLQSDHHLCSCSRNPAGECRECLLRGVSERLRDAGYNSALCRSKWRSSLDIPKGEHTYIDVVGAGSKNGATAARVVIELSFRSEFEVARGSEEYNGLLRQLPEVFVGKPERLRGVVKVVCAAAKKCMKENKMHMGPWRKQKYMQAKWLAPCERVTAQVPPPPTAVVAAFPGEQPRARASMLTFDLLEKPPSLHGAAVEVI